LRLFYQAFFACEVGAEFLKRREVDGDDGELRFEGGDNDHFAENPGGVDGLSGRGSELEQGYEAAGCDDDRDAAEGEDAENCDFFTEAYLAVPDHGDGQEEYVDV
jgi:hypothetical protein